MWFFDIYIDTYFYACDAPNLHRQFTFSFAKKSFELWTDLTRIRSNCLVSQYLGINLSRRSDRPNLEGFPGGGSLVPSKIVPCSHMFPLFSPLLTNLLTMVLSCHLLSFVPMAVH